MSDEREREQTDPKPSAVPDRKDQRGASQPNQSTWETGKAGEVIAPPPDGQPPKVPESRH